MSGWELGSCDFCCMSSRNRISSELSHLLVAGEKRIIQWDLRFL